jgi:hypothetical protein
MDGGDPHDARVDGDVVARLDHIRDVVELERRSEALAEPQLDGAFERWRSATESAARMADPLAFEVRRTGVASRAERLAKRIRGLVAVWTTWPQAKFNEATVSLLRETGELIEAQQRWIADLNTAHRAEVENLVIEQRAMRAALDLVHEQHALALEEHRVVMRQLALEVSEAAQLADRTRRRVEHRLDGGHPVEGDAVMR